MTGPTDKEIFNHMRQEEVFCGRCGCDDVEQVQYEYYKGYKCLACDFEPEPPGEE